MAMKTGSNRGIVALTGAAATVVIISMLLIVQWTQIASWYYSMTPPMKNCGEVPHSEPAYLSSRLSQIRTDPQFIQLENGTKFQYSANSQMVEKYYNGTSVSIAQISFVHLISNSREDIIYVQIFQNGTETFRFQDYNVRCTVVPGTKG
ncbi:MAG: hypothetical protein JRN52_08380 [Nitrososphaerota archaeon]|nr:hypothetical protein [Nitrososphaerota archaeon]